MNNHSQLDRHKGEKTMDIFKIVIPTPFPVGDVNAFLVKGDALTLFDVGPKTEEAYEALKWGIRSAGYDMKDIEQVVLTHHHPDHAGWVDAFSHAEILGHAYIDHWMKKTPEFLQYHETFYARQLREGGVPENYIQKVLKVKGEIELFGSIPLTGYLKEGDEVPGHKGLMVYETLGHGQSHLIFLEEGTRECIGGDLLLERTSSNPLIEPPVDLSMERPKSLLQYNASLQRLKALNVSKLYTGHGGEITEIGDLVDDRLERQKQRALKVYDLLVKPQTNFELTAQLFERLYHQQLGLTLSETLGQLDYLIDNEMIEANMRDGVIYYSRL
ncbi:MBL fold metallo-hydrolase [Solibacillus sp. FSL K6-1523]|uniref:MBL fold metallo-hydrolase n=2 Tax=Solibacillus sp. FSL K6-1523 TaxID=2921471 RepID=UPI0030F854F5